MGSKRSIRINLNVSRSRCQYWRLQNKDKIFAYRPYFCISVLINIPDYFIRFRSVNRASRAIEHKMSRPEMIVQVSSTRNDIKQT